MNYDFKAGMMRAADMCDAHAKQHRERKKSAASVHDKADEQAQEYALTAISLAILTECEAKNETV